MTISKKDEVKDDKERKREKKTLEGKQHLL